LHRIQSFSGLPALESPLSGVQMGNCAATTTVLCPS